MSSADGRNSALPSRSGRTHPPTDSEVVALLQRQLLPALAPELSGYEFAVLYRPCEAAGGDFYGFQKFADGGLGVLVADVSGHGLRAAVMMAALRSAMSAFRVFDRLRESAPQDVNAVINDLAIPGIFITAFFVSLEPRSGRIFCGNCGHPPPLIVRADGRVQHLEGGGSPPMGIVERIEPPTIIGDLGYGDSLVLFTDGVTDARSPAGEAFENSRLKEAASRPAENADGIVRAIREAIDAHVAGAPGIDDQCVVVMRRRDA